VVMQSPAVAAAMAGAALMATALAPPKADTAMKKRHSPPTKSGVGIEALRLSRAKERRARS